MGGKRLTPLWSCGLRSMAQAPVQRRRIGRTEIWRSGIPARDGFEVTKTGTQEPKKTQTPGLGLL